MSDTKAHIDVVLRPRKVGTAYVLLDQRLFSLGEDRFEAFLRVLDNPPEPVEKLRELFKQKAPWET